MSKSSKLFPIAVFPASNESFDNLMLAYFALVAANSGDTSSRTLLIDFSILFNASPRLPFGLAPLNAEFTSSAIARLIISPSSRVTSLNNSNLPFVTLKRSGSLLAFKSLFIFFCKNFWFVRICSDIKFNALDCRAFPCSNTASYAADSIACNSFKLLLNANVIFSPALSGASSLKSWVFAPENALSALSSAVCFIIDPALPPFDPIALRLLKVLSLMSPITSPALTLFIISSRLRPDSWITLKTSSSAAFPNLPLNCLLIKSAGFLSNLPPNWTAFAPTGPATPPTPAPIPAPFNLSRPPSPEPAPANAPPAAPSNAALPRVGTKLPPPVNGAAAIPGRKAPPISYFKLPGFSCAAFNLDLSSSNASL